VLYLRGISTGDFARALKQLLGEDASGLSASSCASPCLFADGVHVPVRLGADKRLCLLVIIGVREDGRKQLLAVEDGYRESTDSWAEVLRDLEARDEHAEAPDR
jgi:putative transposase